MDNIAKLVLGVVGIIGLVVLMIPQGNPLAEKGPANPAAIPAATPDPIANEAPKNEPDSASTVNAPMQDIAAFGQPMLDPTPIGQRKAQPQDQQQNPQQMGNEGNYGGAEDVAPYPANPNYGTPSYGGLPDYQPSQIPNIEQ